MSNSFAEYDTTLTVVERPSHVDGSLIRVFSYAVEGGTYFFSSINLLATRGNEPPTIELDREAGSLCVIRNESVLWEAGRIVNSGGGMGNEMLLHFTDVPEGFIFSYGDGSVDNNGIGSLFANKFEVGDRVLLKLQREWDEVDQSVGGVSDIEAQIQREWDNAKGQIDYLMSRENTESLGEEFDETPKEIEDNHRENTNEAKQMLDNFCFVPSGMA